MDKHGQIKSGKGGYTLVELLISVGLLVILLPVIGEMLITFKFLASESKHKIEAAYVARQLIENQRQNTFISLAAGTSETVSSGSVILDSKGNYSSSSCTGGNTGNFCGTAVMTVIPATYTSTTGTVTTNTNIDRYTVTVDWIEQDYTLQVPMTETYTEDIVNDPMLN